MITVLLSGMPKWLKDFVFSELKPLFLRTRHLDDSKKNRIIQDFLSKIFPSFAENHHERLVVLSADFRKLWSNWRNAFWQKLLDWNEKHPDFNENKNNISSDLKFHHISKIFESWLKHVSSRLSKNDENILRDLVLFGLHCIRKHPDNAHEIFFSSTGNLYTINCNFPSTYNIVNSMELSQYEITLEIIDDNSNEENPKKRFKK